MVEKMQPQQPQKQQQGGVPVVDALKISGKAKKDLKEIANILRTVSFLEVAQEKDAVHAAYIESRDINKAPYLFSIMRIKVNELELIYSIPPEMAPKKRKLEMIRYLLNILSLIEDAFTIDQKTLYQLVELAIKEIENDVTMEQSKIFTAYDTLKRELETLKRKVQRLSEENESLRNKNYELKAKYDEAIVRINNLETLSDETLKSRIQEWISEHDGEINIYEFCKTYNVSETRVEEILNKLVNEGYLELVE
jgi:regulator of replication initiation timing